ncbi:MAG: hypothetical protein NUW01_04470 [Gemmatimonadaceae bacterium]|nr:hypothetical protein [Gemmatimonadaceae bacterium]
MTSLSVSYCPPVAALFVAKDGTYFGLEGIDPWDEERDARLYAGPWPVVAHPPCKSWSHMGNCRPDTVARGDGGTFTAALAAVERFGGVLEHPALSRAWRAFGIPRPPEYGWERSLWPDRIGWTTSVDQAAYGHPCHKETWLYFVGGVGKYAPGTPPTLDWRRIETGRRVAQDGGGGRDQRSRTPEAVRDVLLEMARTVSPPVAAGNARAA